MSVEAILWGLGVGGFASISGAFLFRTLVKSGIEEAIKLNFARCLEDYKSQLSREVERLKVSLKNSETFFSRQLEALTKLRRIFRRIVPKKRSPDMDWHEACEEMAHSFSQHADDLDEFLCAYEAVLPNAVLKKIESAISLATDGTFQFDWNSKEGDPEASQEAIETANQLYEIIKEAVSALQGAVDAQVDGRCT